MNSLAVVLRYQGKYDEAMKLNWRALKGRKKKLGVKHLDTLTSVDSLGKLAEVSGEVR